MIDPSKFIPETNGLKDYFDLWEHFEANGDANKDRMITIVSWLLGFAIAILTYTVTQALTLDPAGGKGWCVKQPNTGVILSFLGLLICLYSGYLVIEFGDHARLNWLRSDKLLSSMPMLEHLVINVPKAEELHLEAQVSGNKNIKERNALGKYVEKVSMITKGFKYFLLIVSFTGVLFMAVLILDLVGFRC